MLKIVETDTEYFRYEPNIRLLGGEGATSQLVKSAADSSVTDFAKGIRPDPSRVYVHILAMGASEFWGANRNADSFPEQQLIDHHATFVSSPAHIFRNHVNKDPAIAIGQVVFSTYNHRMKRVELIAWIDREKGKDVVARIENGDFPPTSMACRTPYDVCSICGNKASTRQEYCEHLSDQLGRVYSDGRKVSALNLAPLTFFDMSIVIKPADVTSAVLQKVASASRVLGSAEIAEQYDFGGPNVKPLNKLAELIKQIDDGEVVDACSQYKPLLDKVLDPPRSVIPELSALPLSNVLSAMATLGMSPSLAFLADLIGYSVAGEDALGIGSLVEGYVKANGANGLDLLSAPMAGGASEAAISVLVPHVKSASLLPTYVIGRSLESRPAENQGYIGNGPVPQEDLVSHYHDVMRKARAEERYGPMGWLRTLLLVSSASIAAKWYIQHEIHKQLQEAASSETPGVKIVLVKSASDANILEKLAQASTVLALAKQS